MLKTHYFLITVLCFIIHDLKVISTYRICMVETLHIGMLLHVHNQIRI